MDFCHLQEIYHTHRKNCTREIRCCKNSFKKVVHKTAEAIGEYMGNKIYENNVRLKPVPDMNSKNVEEIVIPLEERQEILNKLRQLL